MRRYHFCILFLLISFHWKGATIFAQSLHQHDDTTRLLDEVVMTAQRSKQKSLHIPYSVGTLSQQQLTIFGSRTTPEALMTMNGVFVQKTNHGGGSPFIRGLTGNQSLILVDGIRLNNATFRYGPNQYLNTIDVNTIQKIEVVKGSGSVQYGTDAIGGVIHVMTHEPVFATGKSSVQGKVIARYMTDDMEKTIRGETSYSGKKFAFIAGAGKRKFGDLVGGDTTGRQSPSGYDEWAFDAKTKFLLHENISLTLAAQFLQQKNVPVYHKVILENFAINEMDPQQRWLSYARVNARGRSALFSEMEFTLSWQENKEGRNSRKNGSNVLRKEMDRINTVSFTTDILSRFNSLWTANSGIEIYRDKIGSTRADIDEQTGASSPKRGLYPDNSRYGNYSIYSLHHLALGKWMIDAGIRANTFSIRISDTTLGEVKITPSALVANGAILYCIDPRQAVYGSFSSGFRAPNVDDMGTLGIVDFRYEIPTADLKPEHSRHIETGYKISSPKFSATIALYYLHLRNLITRVKEEGQVISGYPVYRKENTESASIKGADARADIQLMKDWNLSAGFAYAYGKNLTKKEPLRRIPPFNGRLESRYTKKKWFVSGEFQFASRQDRLAQGDKEDNRIPAGGTPGWRVINFYTGYKISLLQVNLGIQNILNEDYRTHGSGINNVGRSAWVGITINL